MPYPSFLWKKNLAECGETEARIPESVLTDLMLEGDFRPENRTLLLSPCTSEEIPERQGVLRLLLDDEGFAGRIASLRSHVSEAERLLGQLERSEIEEEKTLLFLPVSERYFSLCEELAELSPYSGKAGEIGAFFGELIHTPLFEEASKRCRDIRAHRKSALRLTIRGGEAHASDASGSSGASGSYGGEEPLRDKIEDTFREMGMELPSPRHPAPASPAVTRGYAEVYGAYYSLAKTFWNEYRAPLLEGAYNLHELYRIGGELGFLTDAASYFRKLREGGYPLCWCPVSPIRQMRLGGLVDPSLLKREVRDPVPNDVFLAAESGGERLNFFLLTGANGGGKTTFLRACGLAVLFFLLGFPVTAESGSICPFDAVYTHFPANESFENSGRFVNESGRAEEILERATADSFAVFNETYSGTDEKKSEEYSERLARTLWERGTFGLYVTHLHAMTGGEIPTLAAVIDESDDNRRTYKIRRVGGTSSSFARDILEKYGMDADSLAKKLAGRTAKEV